MNDDGDDAAGLDASWRGDFETRVATAREYLAFRSLTLAALGRLCLLVAPPMALDSHSPSPSQIGTRHRMSLGARRSSPRSPPQCSSFVRQTRTSPVPSSCPWDIVRPPTLAPLYLAATGGEACLQPKPSCPGLSTDSDCICQSVVTLRNV